MVRMMIPDELKALPEWVKVKPGGKEPAGGKGWQNDRHTWEEIPAPYNKGLWLKETPYLCIDGDRVLKSNSPLVYVDEWAKDFFTRLLQTGTYAELSHSGKGLHVFFKVDPAGAYHGHLEKLKDMTKAKGDNFAYCLPGHEVKAGEKPPMIELFYHCGQQIFLTGRAIGGDTIAPPPSMLNELLEHMPAFIVPPHQQETEQVFGWSESFTCGGEVARLSNSAAADYDVQRAAAMLEYIDPAGLSYHDWIKVGQILHDLGADISVWDAWSQRDPGRYKGGREITGKWASFRGCNGGATIATLHTMAKASGYNERDFAREWHQQHPETVDPARDFFDLGPDEAPAESKPAEAAPPAPKENKPAKIENPWETGVARLLERLNAGDYIPIPTGIDCIDNFLSGGIMRRTVMTIGAPPGAGKSALAQNIVESMARTNEDFSCLYFCFEMGQDILQARSISRMLHQMGRDITTLDVLRNSKPGVLESVGMYGREIASKVAYIGLGDGVKDRTLEAMREVVLKACAYNKSIGRPAPAIVCDYIQLVESPGKDEQESIKDTMGALKSYAVANNTFVIGIVANNRESNKSGEVSMFSGRGSSSIEYGADVCLSLVRTNKLDNSVPDKSKYMSLVITKGRFYGTDDNQAHFTFNGAFAEFVPKDSDDFDNLIDDFLE